MRRRSALQLLLPLLLLGCARQPASAPITSVMVSRNEATIQARDQDGGPVTLRLVFQGLSFSGRWETSNGFVSPVSGVRRQ